MSDSIRVEPTNPFLNWATAIGVMGLAAAGFTLSFSALRELAVKSGIDPRLAFLWPLIVDGFIVVATASAFALKARGRRVTWYPWTALMFFSAISVVGNSIHATEAADLQVPVVVATVVSSVPAIALLLASHLLVVMIDGRSKADKSTATRSGQAAERAADQNHDGPMRKPKMVVGVVDRGARSPASAAGVLAVGHRDVDAEAISAANKADEVADVDVMSGEVTAALVDDTDVLDRLRQHRAAGQSITGALLARELGVSERTGRRRLDYFKATFPDLFELGGVR